MRIAITGSTGLIGKALLSHLRDNGHDTVALVRRTPHSASEIQWDPAKGVLNAKDLEGINAVVHLAGAGIGDKRWTDSYKKEILESRTKSTNAMQALCKDQWRADLQPIHTSSHRERRRIQSFVNIG